MTLKTGRSCTWEEIEVGEVFAYRGCWIIEEKVDDNNSLLLAYSGYKEDMKSVAPIYPWTKRDKNTAELYKLPKSVQRLWKEI